MAIKVTAKKAGKTLKKVPVKRTTNTTSKKAVYSAEEKKAFDLGKAYGAAKKGSRVALKTAAEKQSFRNGVKSVKGTKKC